MSGPATLPLSRIVDVEIFVSAQAPAPPEFNQGLIIGSTNVIPSFGGTHPRIREYFSTDEVLADGFSTSDPEYICANLYFSQSPPPKILWIGRRDLTSIETVALNAAGTGYSVNDVLTVTGGGGTLGLIKVLTVSSGAIATFALVQGGTGYSPTTGAATTGGTGTGATFNITAIGETFLQAVQACRIASLSWWSFMVIGAAKADHEAIAAFVQTMTPVGCYFYTTQDADALSGASGNVFAALKALKYNRVIGMYTTTQSGQFPNNVYASAALMGVAMGQNTGLANSAYTLMFKTLVGIASEPLTPTDITTIENNFGNLYLDYGNTYDFFEQGWMANGQFFDEIINLDMISSGIQFNIMNVLVAAPKIPQTDGGQTRLIHAVNNACEAAFIRGFLGPGVWNGVQILNLKPGDPLPHGYSAQSPAYSTQAPSDRALRKAMPIYVAITESGAVHSILIGVYVQR